MIMTNKLLPVALIAALIGGSVGALVMHSQNEPATQASTQDSSLNAPNAQYAKTDMTQDALQSDFDTPAEQMAYKSGFADGFKAGAGASEDLTAAPSRRVVYRRATRTSSPQRVYYNYNQPQKRSFWQKHRDKLTVAMGTGGGALVGGLVGGKKGAAIGALAGAGGSALYTYKLRDRSRRY